MYNVVPVIVEESKTIYYLSPNDLSIKKDDFVIFELDNTLHYGKVIKNIYKEKKENLILPLNKIVRKVNAVDRKQIAENKKNAEKALEDAKKISKKLNLNMNFIDSYFTFDKSQLIFSFFIDISPSFPLRLLFRENMSLLPSSRTCRSLPQFPQRKVPRKFGAYTH